MAIPKQKAGCPRVTQPFATLYTPEGALIVRLACVRRAASVHPEPGSNSPFKQICVSRLYTNFELTCPEITPISDSLKLNGCEKNLLSIHTPIWFRCLSLIDLIDRSIRFSRFTASLLCFCSASARGMNIRFHQEDASDF